ncbi:protein of unknown function [Cupriavidus taiwanensis]|nr:protein of unknown function [Cupriavidus taiwanensis]
MAWPEGHGAGVPVCAQVLQWLSTRLSTDADDGGCAPPHAAAAPAAGVAEMQAPKDC